MAELRAIVCSALDLTRARSLLPISTHLDPISYSYTHRVHSVLHGTRDTISLSTHCQRGQLRRASTGHELDHRALSGSRVVLPLHVYPNACLFQVRDVVTPMLKGNWPPLVLSSLMFPPLSVIWAVPRWVAGRGG